MQLGRAGGHRPHPRRAPPLVHATSVAEFRRQTLAPDGGCRTNTGVEQTTTAGSLRAGYTPTGAGSRECPPRWSARPLEASPTNPPRSGLCDSLDDERASRLGCLRRPLRTRRRRPPARDRLPARSCTCGGAGTSRHTAVVELEPPTETELAFSASRRDAGRALRVADAGAIGVSRDCCAGRNPGVCLRYER